ncbi:MAG: galactose-binding domain-containing protein [Thiobacillus sp.]
MTRSARSTTQFLVDALVASVSLTYTLMVRNAGFLLAIFATAIFYLPALKNGAANAGFLYGGDVLGWYLPALAKTHTLINSFNFTAIDFSTFNGSSDFFLSPNFFAYHPLVVMYSLLVPPETTDLHELGLFLVALMALHSFIAFYFSLKLFTRFFAFDFGMAALIATTFAFSMHMVNALGQPPFFLCATIIPWAAYGALVYAERPNIRRLVFACLPIVMGFMGGYVPMGIASLALSVIVVATRILYLEDAEISLNQRVRTLLSAMLPYVTAALIVGPYLYSVYKFHQETSSAGVASIFYSAHQLAQLPQSLLKLVSQHFSVPGPIIEFSLAFGFIALAIAMIFFLSPNATRSFNSSEWKLFKVSSVIYFATVLATFGDYSVVSDLVYYLVPQVGGMHIYQRFLLPAQLLFGLMLALMLKALVAARPLILTRIAMAMFAAATIWVAYQVAYKPVASQEMGLNNFLIFELFLGFLFLCALIVPGKKFVYFAAIVLISLPALDRMYDNSLRGNTLEEQRKRQPVALNEAERQRVVHYFKRFSDKEVIKYVDITPMWGAGGTELFPKVFPYFVLGDVSLSSYGGFTFYLSARAEYMRRMPVMGEVAVSPDWELVSDSGGDFVIARLTDLQNGGLSSLLAKTKAEDMLSLDNGVVIAPLNHRKDELDALFDNGYFKVLPVTNNPRLQNIAVGKSAQQSSAAGGQAQLAVDGNTDGDFAHGSVSHTGQDANAWLEIDLGAIEPIDSVRIWNRTDCCGERLRDYWLFISEQPFLAGDTAAVLRSRPSVWGQVNLTPNPKSTIETSGVQGRYIRVQLNGDRAIDESFLSLAEVEVFRSDFSSAATGGSASPTGASVKVKEFITNNASYLRLSLETSSPVTVQYLFWSNPRLKYYLNGNRVDFTERDGRYGIDIPAGLNTIEIKYTHWPLRLFWVIYALYALVFFWALISGQVKKRTVKQ